MAGLKTYHAKRRFGVTAEPKGKIAGKAGHAFVIQKRAARRLLAPAQPKAHHVLASLQLAASSEASAFPALPGSSAHQAPRRRLLPWHKNPSQSPWAAPAGSPWGS